MFRKPMYLFYICGALLLFFPQFANFVAITTAERALKANNYFAADVTMIQQQNHRFKRASGSGTKRKADEQEESSHQSSNSGSFSHRRVPPVPRWGFPFQQQHQAFQQQPHPQEHPHPQQQQQNAGAGSFHGQQVSPGFGLPSPHTRPSSSHGPHTGTLHGQIPQSTGDHRHQTHVDNQQQFFLQLQQQQLFQQQQLLQQQLLQQHMLQLQQLQQQGFGDSKLQRLFPGGPTTSSTAAGCGHHLPQTGSFGHHQYHHDQPASAEHPLAAENAIEVFSDDEANPSYTLAPLPPQLGQAAESDDYQHVQQQQAVVDVEDGILRAKSPIQSYHGAFDGTTHSLTHGSPSPAPAHIGTSAVSTGGHLQQQPQRQFILEMHRGHFNEAGAIPAGQSEAFPATAALPSEAALPSLPQQLQHHPTIPVVNQQPHVHVPPPTLFESLWQQIEQHKISEESLKAVTCQYINLLEQKKGQWLQLKEKIALMEKAYVQLGQDIPVSCPQPMVGPQNMVGKKEKTPAEQMSLDVDVADLAIRLSLFPNDESFIRMPDLLMQSYLYELFGDNNRQTCFLLFKATNFLNMPPAELHQHIGFWARKVFDGEGKQEAVGTLAVLISTIVADLLAAKKELVFNRRTLTPFLGTSPAANIARINQINTYTNSNDSKAVDPLWNLLLYSNLYNCIQRKFLKHPLLPNPHITTIEPSFSLDNRLLLIRENAMKFIGKALEEIEKTITAIIVHPEQTVQAIRKQKEHCMQNYPAMFGDALMSQQDRGKGILAE